MKVKQLINELKKLDPKLEVIMSKDGEGNGYSQLSDLCDGYVYVPECTWSGEIYPNKLTAQNRKYGFSEEDLYSGDGGKDCVVIYPTN